MTGVLKEFSDAREGLAFEADLLNARQPVAGVWTSKANMLVCPFSYRRKPGFRAAAVASSGDGWPVLLRPTGGGAVPQGAGVLNLAVALTVPRGFGIAGGYRLITGIVRRALGDVGSIMTAGPTPGSFCDGDWNLSIAGKKVVGTAQRWRPIGAGRSRVLAHALILAGGGIKARVEAVSAFNRAICLGPVLAKAHTTLERVQGGTRPEMAKLARELHAVAVEDLQAIETRRTATAAA